jgi:hypothetical protein
MLNTCLLLLSCLCRRRLLWLRLHLMLAGQLHGLLLL